MNERGQGLSISSIILIILGIIVLVILALGFFVGWNNIVPYVSSNNANTVSSQCTAACTTSSVYDFCSRTITLNAGSTTLNNVTCNYLAQAQPQYGITSCSSVQCNNIVIIPSSVVPTNSNLATLQAQCQSNPGKTVQALISNTLQSINC